MGGMRCTGRATVWLPSGRPRVRPLGPSLALVLCACATYQPGTLEPEVYLARAESETRDGVTVTTLALSAAESATLFARRSNVCLAVLPMPRGRGRPIL